MVQRTEEFRQVPIAALRESTRNPRKTYDAAKMAELVNSIRQVGITTPLLGRPHPTEEGAVEIAAGHRRRRAAIVAELETVPIVVRNYSDAEFYEVLAIENLQRADIHPMEEAEGYDEWLRGPGNTVPALAARLGKKDGYVYQRLRLLELIDPLREDLRSDRFTIGHATALAPLGAAQQKEMRDHYLYDREGGCVSLRAVQVAIETKVYMDLSKAVFPIHDEKLLPAAGSCDRCEKRTGANPALFPEVKEKDQCLDRACFYKKANVFASQKLKQIEKKNAAEGKPAGVPISGHWGTDKKGVLSTDQYRIVRRGKECESTLDAVCVEEQYHGQGEVRLGEAVKICTNKKCKQHWGGLYHAPQRAELTPGELKRQLAEKEKEETAQKVRAALIGAAVEAAGSPFELEELREIARVMWARLWHDHRVVVLARRGLRQQTTRDSHREDVMRKAIRSMDGKQLAGLIVEIAIMEDGNSLEAGEEHVLELALGDVGPMTRRQVAEDATTTVKAAYDAKRARIDKAEEKRKATAKAEKAAAAKKDQPAATPAAKKGKAKKS